MPKKFFRRYLPSRTEIQEQSSLRSTLGDLLHDPNIWHLNRRSVAGGFAIGLFVAWIPLPMQTPLAGFAALMFRVNLPLSVILVWVSNPLTWVPMFWFAWKVGAFLLGIENVPATFEPTLEWFATGLTKTWLPLAVGSLVMGMLSSAIGFLICRLAWRYHVVRHVLRRRRRSTDESSI